jgi:beta-galactosidase
VTDQHGVTAPRANDPIKFSIEGPGKIVATDNGDPTSFESFQAPERKAFNGYCLVVVRSEAGRTGNIIVTATSGDLQQATTLIKSVRAR